MVQRVWRTCRVRESTSVRLDQEVDASLPVPPSGSPSLVLGDPLPNDPRSEAYTPSRSGLRNLTLPVTDTELVPFPVVVSS